MNNKNIISGAARGYCLLLLFCLSGCATTGPHDPIRDPLEPMNRAIFKFNDKLDRWVLWPVTKGYKKVVPQFGRTGVTNFFNNLRAPIIVINDLLQFKIEQAGADTTRFVVNSTLGVLGFFDPATHVGLEQHEEDFGQTLAVWGVPEGWYIVLPVLGPKTLWRDSVGFVGDLFADPLWWGLFGYADERRVRWGLIALRAIDTRSQLPSPDVLTEGALDPYIFLRESYRQRRWYLIYDGEVPEEELPDDFLFEDEEPENEAEPMQETL